MRRRRRGAIGALTGNVLAGAGCEHHHWRSAEYRRHEAYRGEHRDDRGDS